MYSQLVDKLGVSQSSIEILVIIAIGIAIAGYIFVTFFKQIIFGALAVFCFIVFTQSNNQSIAQIKNQNSTKENNTIVIPEDKKEFMEDCQNMTDYTKEQCDNIWENKNPNTEIVETKFKRV